MAGGPSGLLIAITSVLLFYLILAGVVGTMVVGLGNYYNPNYGAVTVNTPGISNFGYVPNGTSVSSFLYNGQPNDLGINVLNNSVNDVFGGGTSLNRWGMNDTRGLYPISIGQGTASVTAMLSQYAAEVEFGKLNYSYVGNTRQQSKSINFKNLGGSGETDILLAVSSQHNGFTTSYYYISVLNGRMYLANKQTTAYIYTSVYTTDLQIDVSGNPTTTIGYTYDMYSGFLSVYVDGLSVYSHTYDMRDTDILGGPLAYTYGSTDHPVDVLTTNMDMSITGTGSITPDGVTVPDNYVVSLANPFGSDSWRDLAKIFFQITLWTIDGIPLEINLIFFKLPLVVFALCLVAIGLSLIP